jgi:hypothetical protein
VRVSAPPPAPKEEERVAVAPAAAAAPPRPAVVVAHPAPKVREPVAPAVVHTAVLAAPPAAGRREAPYALVSTVELRFAGRRERVGVRGGSQVEEKFLLYAGKLLADLKSSKDL